MWLPTLGGPPICHPKDTKSGPPPGCAGGAPAHVGGRTPPAHGVPVVFLPIWARNGSEMDENQHNLTETDRNFDASPAVTTGMRQDP